LSNWAFSKKIALRYLWSKRGEAFITIITVVSVLGVALGVMVLNIVMAVMTGFEHELREKLIGANSHIVVRKLGGRIAGWREVEHTIGGMPGVQSVSAFTYNQALLKGPHGSVGLLVRGIQKDSAAEKQVVGYLDRPEDINRLYDPPRVKIRNTDGEEEEVQLPALIVGRELTRSMSLFVGTPVSLLSPGVSDTPFGLMPRFKRFVLAAAYKSGLVEYESGMAYTSLEAAQQFFQLGDAVSGLEVRVDDIEQAPAMTKRIKDVLDGLAPGFYAQDWTETNKPLWDAIQLEKRAYFIVLLLIVVMASFSIVTTLIMIVLEKRKDIAVMKTLGASSRSVSRIFMLTGSVIGGLGTVLGVVFGVLGCIALREYGFPLDESIFQMSKLPVRMEWENFAMTALAAFSICCVATIYPARRAASLEPSEVLRYE
jgi:lipoprotein-releasing system permease protein